MQGQRAGGESHGEGAGTGRARIAARTLAGDDDRYTAYDGAVVIGAIQLTPRAYSPIRDIGPRLDIFGCQP